jgi:hypothetical protein
MMGRKISYKSRCGAIDEQGGGRDVSEINEIAGKETPCSCRATPSSHANIPKSAVSQAIVEIELQFWAWLVAKQLAISTKTTVKEWCIDALHLRLVAVIPVIMLIVSTTNGWIIVVLLKYVPRAMSLMTFSIPHFEGVDAVRVMLLCGSSIKIEKWLHHHRCGFAHLRSHDSKIKSSVPGDWRSWCTHSLRSILSLNKNFPAIMMLMKVLILTCPSGIDHTLKYLFKKKNVGFPARAVKKIAAKLIVKKTTAKLIATF